MTTTSVFSTLSSMYHFMGPCHPFCYSALLGSTRPEPKWRPEKTITNLVSDFHPRHRTMLPLNHRTSVGRSEHLWILWELGHCRLVSDLSSYISTTTHFSVFLPPALLLVLVLVAVVALLVSDRNGARTKIHDPVRIRADWINCVDSSAKLHEHQSPHRESLHLVDF